MKNSLNVIKKFLNKHSFSSSAQVCLGSHHLFFIDIPFDQLLSQAIDKQKEPPYILEYDIDFSIPDNVNIEILKVIILRDLRVYFPRRLRDSISIEISSDRKTYRLEVSQSLK